MARHIAITSGKGGVGKTSVSVNLAYQLVRMGYNVCLFDADLGLANVNILLGLTPQFNLKDVILNEKEMHDILIQHSEGLDILPGSSGFQEIVNLDPQEMQKLIGSFQEMDDYDFFIFDTSAGISKEVISFCIASPEVLVVITPEPTSLTDAYALVKVLSQRGYSGSIDVIVNRCRSSAHAKLVYNKFKSAAAKFLGIKIGILGVIMEDANVSDAVAAQKPFMAMYPGSAASKCIEKIAERLLDADAELFTALSTQNFWERCLNILGGPFRAGRKTETPNVGKEESIAQEAAKPAEQKGGKKSAAGEEKHVERERGDTPVEPNLLGEVALHLRTVSSELQLIRKSIERLAAVLPATAAGAEKNPE